MPILEYNNNNLQNGVDDPGKLLEELNKLQLAKTTIQQVGFSRTNNIISIFVDKDPTDSDRSLIDTAVNEHTGGVVLSEYKTQAIMSVDAATRLLIANGFDYRSKKFSLSAEAQLKMNGALVAKDILSYPVVWSNLDNTDTITISNKEEMESFCATALNTIRQHLDKGTELKSSIRSATTKENVDIIAAKR